MAQTEETYRVTSSSCHEDNGTRLDDHVQSRNPDEKARWKREQEVHSIYTVAVEMKSKMETKARSA